jgi:hypothetical protein
MRTLRGYPATMTAQWCSHGPSGSTMADAEAKSVTKEAVYMLAFRCLVLLARVEGVAALFVRCPERHCGALERVASQLYELCAVFWLGESVLCAC